MKMQLFSADLGISNWRLFPKFNVRLITADLMEADLMRANESYGINGMQILPTMMAFDTKRSAQS